ncbi:MAG: T9SS type A sorting domain-containing protein [Bacteroidetes bacterium]|nr:T9SS type A sorting domain-containing protein [Bacteroidota bacterium]
MYKVICQSPFVFTKLISGTSEARSFIQLKDSGFLVVGMHNISITLPTYFSFAYRLDKYGNEIWTKIYQNIFIASDIEMLNDTSAIITGKYANNPNITFTIIDLNGDSITSIEYIDSGTDISRLIKRINNNEYLLNNVSINNYAFQVLDSNFNDVWHDYANFGFAGFIYPDIDNGYFACGYSDGLIDPYQVQRRDSNGTIIWNRNYGNLWNNSTPDLYATGVVCEDSNYLIGCDRGEYELMKLDRNTGDTLWTKNINAGSNESYIFPLSYNRFIFPGDVSSFKYYLIDQNADTINSFKTACVINYAKQTYNGGFAYCGYFWKNNTYYSCLISCDSLGNTIFTSQIELPQQDEVSAFPNPADDYVTFAWPTVKQNKLVTLTIYDAQGIVHLQKMIAPQEQININQLANGIYNAVISNGERQMRTRFVVVR